VAREHGILADGENMPDWLIGLSIVSAASSPSWTDWIQTGAAVIAAVGVVGGFVYSGIQLRKARREQTAQRALSLMQLLIEITRIMVERPYLAPYIYDGKDPPGQGQPQHDEVLAYGRLFMSFRGGSRMADPGPRDGP
jgi:hypothetical protein